jgi:AAA+ superfamily predicted ATPase
MKFITRVLIISLIFATLIYVNRDVCYEYINEYTNNTDASFCETYDNKIIYVHNKPIKLNNYENYIATSALIQENQYSLSNISSVIGHNHILLEIDSVTNLWNHDVDKSENTSLYDPPTGILLYGPPGTGKTTLSKQICNRLNARVDNKQPVSFLHVSSDLIENKYQGEGLKLMRAVFTLCSKIQPCILFFDEIDGFMSKRSDMDQSHVNNMKTIVLSAMDHLRESKRKVLVIAATNRPECIDPALMRRLELHFHMNTPTIEDKCNMFVNLLGGNIVDYKDIVETIFPVSLTLHDIQAFLRFCVRKHLRHSPDIAQANWSKENLVTSYNEYITTFKFITNKNN